MAQKFEFEWKDQWVPWALVGIVFLLVQFLGRAADTLGYGYVYGLSFLIVAYMLFIDQFGDKSPNSYGFLVGAFFASMNVFVGHVTFPLTWVLVLCVIAIIFMWYAQNQDFGVHRKDIRYFAIVPMLMWSLWAFLFLSEALSEAILFQQLMYQGGILLFGVWSSFRLLGVTEATEEKRAKVSMVLAVIVLCGMLLISSQLGLPLTWT